MKTRAKQSLTPCLPNLVQFVLHLFSRLDTTFQHLSFMLGSGYRIRAENRQSRNYKANLSIKIMCPFRFVLPWLGPPIRLL